MEDTKNIRVVRKLRSITDYLNRKKVSAVIDYTKSSKHVPYVKIYYRGQQYRIVYFHRYHTHTIYENGKKLITIKDRNDLLSYCSFLFLPSQPPEINLYKKITKQEFNSKYGQKT